MSPVGATTLTVTNQKTHEQHEVDFAVVQNDLTGLIGSTTVQEMGLLTVHADQFVAEVKGSTQNKRTNERKTDDESRPSTTLRRKLLEDRGNAPLLKLGLEALLPVMQLVSMT